MSAPPDAPESPAVLEAPAWLAERRLERRAEARRRRLRRRRLILVGVAVLVLLSPAVYSYTATMVQPSSLPLGVRSVEWLRGHHGNWLVDEVEQRLLRLEGAEEGRAAAEEPAEGRSGAGDDVRAHLRAAAACRLRPGRPGSSRSSPCRCRAKGSGRRPARSSTDTRRSSSPPSAPRPTIRASSPTSPGSTTRERRSPSIPAATSRRARRCAGRCRSLRPALAPARHLQRRLHLQGRPQRLVDQRPQLRAAQGRPGDPDRLPRRPRRHQDVDAADRTPGRRSHSPARACR